jgi:hypothetical protein
MNPDQQSLYSEAAQNPMDLGEGSASQQAHPEHPQQHSEEAEQAIQLMSRLIGQYSELTDRLRNLEDKNRTPHAPSPAISTLQVPPIAVSAPQSPAVSALHLEAPEQGHSFGSFRLQ